MEKQYIKLESKLSWATKLFQLGAGKIFCVKSQTANVLGFVGYRVSVKTLKTAVVSAKPAIDNTYNMNNMAVF